MTNKYFVYLYFNLLDPEHKPFYVGQGRENRWKIFNHKRSSNRFLRDKIRELGEENILVTIPHKNLTQSASLYLEAWYIKYYGRRDLGTGCLCNLTDKGWGTPGHKGKHHTEETKQKMSEARRGKKNSMFGKHHTEETKKKMSLAKKGKYTGEKHWAFGKCRTEETKRKLSEANKGRRCTEETKKKISATKKASPSFKGKHHTEETKRKISAAKRGEKHPLFGKHHSESAKRKMSEAHKGHKHSEETKRKMSETHKRRIKSGR